MQLDQDTLNSRVQCEGGLLIAKTVESGTLLGRIRPDDSVHDGSFARDQMKIHVIPFEGPIKREIEGLQLLATQLPEEWFAYANCELALNDGTYVEIDVVIVADDRVFLIDLKDWRGSVQVDEKGRWLLNGRPLGGSAARKIRENAKKTGVVLRQKLRLQMFVEGYVLFSATADFSQLPAEDDLAQTMSIADFCGGITQSCGWEA